MKLKTIIFENFRQFYGKQILNLETSDDKNLIIIHAENNVGKTTFLKGFTWCLFKKETFKRRVYLNDYVFSLLSDNETAALSVTLIFDDRNREYSVKRSMVISNINDKQYPKEENLEVKIDGVPQSNQQDTINRILNPELSNYFFFEGESIGEMSSPENKDEIKNGIQYIMGLEVYDRAIRHTYNAKEYFRKSLRELESVNGTTSDSPVAKKAEKYMKIQEEKKKLENTHKYLRQKDAEKKDIREELALAEDVERYEKEIIRLERIQYKLTEEDIELVNKIKNLISSNAYLSISTKTVQTVDVFLKEKRKKGELPSNIREQFVHDLLSDEKCICGTSLHDNENAKEQLKSLLKKTVKKDIEERFIDVNGFTSSNFSFSENFIDNLHELVKQRKILENELDENAKLLVEETTRRKNNSGSNTQELLAKLDAISTTIEEKNQLIGEYKSNIKKLDIELQEIEKELKDYHSQNSKINREENRLILAESTLKLIDDEYQLLTNKVREKLTEKVSEIFDSIIHGNYKIQINSKFELELTKIVNEQEGETELSRGQEQIASLSFIASLVYIAKKWDEEHKKETWGGAGIYPMVMDSPFGTLGQYYQSALTKKLKDLAPQIILMVSSSQWTQEVARNFSENCQHEYVFQHMHPKDQNIDQEYEDIIINGGSYALEKVHEFEYTKIIEVK